jgi:hypothetical protein
MGGRCHPNYRTRSDVFRLAVVFLNEMGGMRR